MSDTNNSNNDAKSQYETFDDFLASVDEPIRNLYEKHTSGLISALDKERSSRKELEKQMKELLPKAEKGSTLEKELAERVRELEESEKKYVEIERKARFAEEANSANIKCTNVKAAYALATLENLFEENGAPKWNEIRKFAPELFKISGTDAGSTNSNTLTGDVNAAIRQAAFGR